MAQFGVVAPGRPILTEFQPISETKAIVVIEQPFLVTELTFFLLSPNVCPIGYGAILYYSTDQINWELLGSVSNSKPSGIFRTGWSTKEELVGIPFVYLGVSLEP
jgi:hypothetical protein